MSYLLAVLGGNTLPEMPYTRVDMTRTSGLMNIRRWCAEYRNNVHVLIHCARAADNEIARYHSARVHTVARSR